MGYIDVDTHVTETEDTWDYMDPGERHYRPRRSIIGKPAAEGHAPPRFWLTGDTWAREMPEDGNVHGNANVFTDGTLTLDNVPARIEDCDALGIDFQVVISTFWIGVEIENPLEEAAVARGYNRWVGERLSGNTNRIGWTVRPPIRNMDRAMEELEWGRNHGAVGVHLHGFESGHYLSDPYLYPIYEKAQDLDMPIIVHIGAITRIVPQLPIGRIVPAPEAMMWHVHTALAAFCAIITSDLSTRFPRLRWGIVEGGASWAPMVLQQSARLVASAGSFLNVKPMSVEEITAKNIYIACEADEDLPYLTRILGEDVLVTGTDYGHNDIGSELACHAAIASRTDLPDSVSQKIVDTNGRKLFGLPADLRPAAPVLKNPPAMMELPHVRGALPDDRRAFVAAR